LICINRRNRKGAVATCFGVVIFFEIYQKSSYEAAYRTRGIFGSHIKEQSYE